MPSRSAHHNQYDDPYTFDDPYARGSPPTNAYEYVGTDEPPSYPQSPVNEPHRRSSPSRRYSRTTSPPRHSRHGQPHAPPPSRHARGVSPPPRDSRHGSPAAKGGSPTSHSKRQKYQGKYQEFAQRPGVQRAQTFGKKGLGLMGDAAEAYLSARVPGETLPPPPEPRRGRSAGHHSGYDDYDHEPRHGRHGRRPAYSPSPSPPRRRSGRHDDRRRPEDRRHKAYSVSPPRHRRDPDHGGYDDERRSRRRDRDQHQRRAYSLSPSPPPRTRDRSSRRKSSGFRSGMMDGVKTSKDANATRWQMAARAALEAGGATALRLRNQPGSWTGDKGAKIATAALGAAAIDAFIDKDPRRSKEGGMKGMATSAITGMIASKVMGFKSHTTHKGKPRYGY